jgi:CheY-like chemotaxis protein
MSEAKRADILIVDDLPEKHLTYRLALEELDQSIVAVASGEEALQLLLEHEFAVILLDVNMPGMSGLETAALIRQRKKISAHTHHLRDGVCRRCADRGGLFTRSC